ncbi:gustatory receptor for sugar taste 64e-like isoform X1 [Frankliniella occidentalis]|uniref:Gustatory receptor for sugar taste 64e-like isoform X1 n=1 Tax=Frankliniella occidentalis TaxID=133901 RepID=A0A9C6X651_FRAOC|nr:gustatory receptor for sugar taste 64e-like isoform X1 [Frankliniella occidentalis]
MKRVNGWRPPPDVAGPPPPAASASPRKGAAWAGSAPTAGASASPGHAVWMSPGTVLLRGHRVDTGTPGSASPKKQKGESFHEAMSGILVAAQVFGLLPVRGVRRPSPLDLRFERRSSRVAWSLVLFVGVCLVELVSLRHMALTLSADTFGVIGGIGAATAGAVFYGNALIGALLMFRLAQRWPRVMEAWADMEATLRKGRTPKLRLRFSVLCAVVMLGALVEHTMSMLNAVPIFIGVHFYGETRPPPEDGQHVIDTSSGVLLEFLDEYCHASHSFIFNHVPYNAFTGLLIFIMSKVTTFTWNFVDLFLMLVSTGLAERFKQFNAVVFESDVAMLNKEDWRELREYFATLSALTKNVDSNICSIVFLSFGNNLYFICLQLLNGLSLVVGDHVLLLLVRVPARPHRDGHPDHGQDQRHEQGGSGRAVQLPVGDLQRRGGAVAAPNGVRRLGSDRAPLLLHHEELYAGRCRGDRHVRDRPAPVQRGHLAAPDAAAAGRRRGGHPPDGGAVAAAVAAPRPRRRRGGKNESEKSSTISCNS